MDGLLRCVFYLAAIGLALFLLGRMMPKKWMLYDRFPYSPFPFEQNGKIYQALRIHRWREKLPDMSKILPAMMPSKKLPKGVDAGRLERMVQETCVAELVHWILMLLGLWSCRLWHTGGFILWIFYDPDAFIHDLLLKELILIF